MGLLRTPLFDWFQEHHARMVDFGGWEMPVQLSSIIAEHKAVRSASGWFDISHMARLRLEGPDALAFIQKVYTNDASKMKVGQVKYGLICNDNGGVLDDVLVTKFADHWVIVVNASNREKILAWFEKHRESLNLSIVDQTFDTAMIAVQGPNTLSACAGLFLDDPSQLKYYHAFTSSYQGQPCVVSRTGYTGEDGFEITVTKTQAIELANDLHRRGVVACGLGARDTLRLEAGMPLYGHELNESITPIQAGLDWAVKFNKGDFIGKEILLECEALVGRQLQRVGLVLEGKRAARENSQIISGNMPMGVVTSGSYSPTLDRSIAMGYVAGKCAIPDCEVYVDIRGSLTLAKVVYLPFYKRPAAVTV